MLNKTVEFAETTVDGNNWFELEVAKPDKPLLVQYNEFLQEHPYAKIIATALSENTTGCFIKATVRRLIVTYQEPDSK